VYFDRLSALQRYGHHRQGGGVYFDRLSALQRYSPEADRRF
jgi:hypothetical protein